MNALPITHLTETTSTNRWAALHDKGADFVVCADYQTAGRGCGANTWESQPGQNLLFSLLIHPHGLAATRQFVLSRAIAVAIVKALEPLTGPLSIKWPNDIYFRHGKLAGILIENQLSGPWVRQSILGVGVNVNQTRFESDAPNPVSLRQITGRRHDPRELLEAIILAFTLDVADADYDARLYRRQGFHLYRDSQGIFEAELQGVEPNGHLLLRDRQARTRRYAFKEVTFIPAPNS